VLTHTNGQAAGACCTSLTVPDELIPFSEPSSLLPGESLHDFEVLQRMTVDDIQPQTNIEWLWTLDLVELSWRHRCLKNRILEAYRVAAIEAILRRLDGEGMPAEAMPMVEMQAKRTANEWRDDRDAAIEIEARLHQSGFDNIDINAEVFVQARELFAMFDQLMQSAQSRRIGLMREISVRREFSIRVRPGLKDGGWFVIVSLNGSAGSIVRHRNISSGSRFWLSYGGQPDEVSECSARS
jgi:hypothetical protein